MVYNCNIILRSVGFCQSGLQSLQYCGMSTTPTPSPNSIETGSYISSPSFRPLVTVFSACVTDNAWIQPAGSAVGGNIIVYSSYEPPLGSLSICYPYGGSPIFSPGLCYAGHTMMRTVKMLAAWLSLDDVKETDTIWRGLCCPRYTLSSDQSSPVSRQEPIRYKAEQNISRLPS